MSEEQDIYAQFLRFAITESAASTFTEGSPVLTGASLNPVRKEAIAMEIHSIICNISHPADLPAAGANEYVWFCLSTRPDLAAMPAMNDDHVVYMNATTVRAGVAVYLPLMYYKDEYMPHYMVFPRPILMSHDKLYPYIISTNAAAVANANVVIEHTFVLLEGTTAIEAMEAFR